MNTGALLETYSEGHLLARVAKKDPEAFAEFYDRTSGVLFSIAKSILIDAVVAEDVLQDVYLQIWEKAGQFDPALGKPISWAIALTRNKALDRLRSSKRRDSAMQEFAQNLPEEASGTLVADVESRERANVVKGILSGLPEKQRQAIELTLINGLSHAEVAETMNEPLGTTKAWIRRGIIEIRKQLENDV